MVYGALFFLWLVLIVLSGRKSIEIWRYYEKFHPELYATLDVIDNTPKAKWEWFMAQWVRPAPSTYIDPSSEVRLNIRSLSKDIELAESTNDSVLLKMVHLGWRYWQVAFIYSFVVPMGVIAYWVMEVVSK